MTIPTQIFDSFDNKDDITEKREESEIICPVMRKSGYSGKNARCSYPRFREMIPDGLQCCSKDNLTCLLVKVPGCRGENRLVEEIIFMEYYKEDLPEDAIKKQIIAFFRR